MEDPDFLNAEKLKLVLNKAQAKIANLLTFNESLEVLNKSRNPAAKKLLQNLIENSNEINLNDIISISKANEDIIILFFPLIVISTFIGLPFLSLSNLFSSI